MKTALSLATLALVGAAFYLTPGTAVASRALLAGAAVACLGGVALEAFSKRKSANSETRALFTAMRSQQIGEFLSYVLYQLREYLISVTSIVEQLALTPAKDVPGVGERLERLRKVIGELNMKAGRLLGDQSAVTTQRTARTSFSIPDVATRCLNATLDAYGPGVTGTFAVEGEVPAVSGDRRAFQTALLAVMQNAFDACSRKNGGRVAVVVRKTDNRAQVEITDDGGGVDSPGDALFEPLHSARGGTEGLGLGLSMGRRLMERCGGTLRLKTKAPYTAVLLEFPLGGDLPFVRNEESTWAGRRDKI